jgi:hypothetical protein
VDRALVERFERRDHDPRRDDVADRRAGLPQRAERRHQSLHGLGDRQQPAGDLGRDPERSLASQEEPSQVEAVREGVRGPEIGDPAIGQDDPHRRDVPFGRSVLEAVGAARVLRDVAADRADGLAGGIGRVVEAVRADGVAQVLVDDARLHDREAVPRVDAEDPVHADGLDQDPARRGGGAARQPGARAAGAERDRVTDAGADDRLDLLGRLREHDDGGDLLEVRERVAFVDEDPPGRRQRALFADDGAEIADGGRDRGRVRPSASA